MKQLVLIVPSDIYLNARASCYKTILDVQVPEITKRVRVNPSGAKPSATPVRRRRPTAAPVAPKPTQPARAAAPTRLTPARPYPPRLTQPQAEAAPAPARSRPSLIKLVKGSFLFLLSIDSVNYHEHQLILFTLDCFLYSVIE